MPSFPALAADVRYIPVDNLSGRRHDVAKLAGRDAANPVLEPNLFFTH